MSVTTGHPAGERPPSILRGLAIQARVIHALILRELQTRFGRSQLGFLWLFVEPLLLAGAIATMHWLWRESGARIPGVPVFVFYLVGYIPYFAFRAIISRATGAFQANMTLMYHRNVKLFDIVVARHILEAMAVMVIMGVVVIGVAMVTERVPHSLPALVGAIALMMLYAHGLGLLAAAISSVSEIAERLIHPLIYLSLPLSGAFFTMHSMPTHLRELLLWNPQVHLHELMREGMFGDVLVTYFDVPYVVWWVAAVNLLGMCALRAVRPRLEF